MPLIYTSFLGSGGGAAWQTVLNAAVAGDNGGWNTYTMRQFFDESLYLVSGGTQIRVTLKAGASAGFVIDNCFIGHGAASGESYDFETTPTRLTFSGSNGVTVGAGSQIVSDGSAFVLNPAKNLLVTVHFSGTSTVASRTQSVGVHQGFYKFNVSEAATIDVTGYTASNSYMVSKVEIFV